MSFVLIILISNLDIKTNKRRTQYEKISIDYNLVYSYSNTFSE